ncbi:transcriptional regulator [Virgisporangium aliadipatigenens]|uniref:Transcriptional regulator n=1 Tax=Virgisporangium aliadipatigenens TaxID=741659 RepID=A0A8J3YWN0_9ACTN|nr:helix-turn-helix transcriptional regulator [Virgisporangium aliadipatigenens]GIJ51877.1 transcriptional regulator [Virgisporangium aliadipatigenens]
MEFGRAVRRWRDRVRPEAAGLPAGGHRRAAGLRREEVALLAGISVDYLTRLEQGRAANPSGQVVEALARALRLTDAERAHLFGLAGLVPPGPEAVPTHISPSVHRMLDRLAGTPVAVFDATWTLLSANREYAALMGDPSGRRGHERNGVWRNFCGPPQRVRQTPEERRAFRAALVADLHATAARYPDDPALRSLIRELRQNEDFAALWENGGVEPHRAARKIIDHPQVGPLTLDCDILTVAGSDLRIMVYTAAPGTDDAERLALVTVLGTQSLV